MFKYTGHFISDSDSDDIQPPPPLRKKNTKANLEKQFQKHQNCQKILQTKKQLKKNVTLTARSPSKALAPIVAENNPETENIVDIPMADTQGTSNIMQMYKQNPIGMCLNRKYKTKRSNTYGNMCQSIKYCENKLLKTLKDSFVIVKMFTTHQSLLNVTLLCFEVEIKIFTLMESVVFLSRKKTKQFRMLKILN